MQCDDPLDLYLNLKNEDLEVELERIDFLLKESEEVLSDGFFQDLIDEKEFDSFLFIQYSITVCFLIVKDFKEHKKL